jgi:hypothetical protein
MLPLREQGTDAWLHRIDRLDGGRLELRWVAARDIDEYEIYRGELAAPFVYEHDTALACGLPPATASWSTPDDQETGQPSYYYLVVARRGAQREWGVDGSGTPRPPSSLRAPSRGGALPRDPDAGPYRWCGAGCSRLSEPAGSLSDGSLTGKHGIRGMQFGLISLFIIILRRWLGQSGSGLDRPLWWLYR